MFFLPLETVLKDVRNRVNWRNLEADMIAFDEDIISLLQGILLKSMEVVLLGPRDSGKTVTAKVLGFKLLKEEKGCICFYGNALHLDLGNITEVVGEIRAYEHFSKRALFILENCDRNLTKMETLFQRLGDYRNIVLLLTTRHLGPEKSILRVIAQEGLVVRVEPEKLREHIVRKHIEQLSKKPSCANSPHFPKHKAEREAQITGLLLRLPKRNLRILDLYLQAWNPHVESLAEVEERKVLDSVLTRTIVTLSPEAKACLLQLCAINQYEVGVHMTFLDREGLRELEDLGIVQRSDRTGFCRLYDPSEAPWHLKAAEQARLLQVEGWPTDIAAYVRHHMLKYATASMNPQKLLQALRSDNKDLATQIISDPAFEEYSKEIARQPFFLPDLPDLLSELRNLNRSDLCLQIIQTLSDNVLNEIGELGVDTVGRYLCEFFYGRRGYRSQGLAVAQRLTQQPSTQPHLLAKEFVTGLDLEKYSVCDLATLLFTLNSLRTYEISRLLAALDMLQLKARFAETSLTCYATLMREVKRAKVGLSPVRMLTPDLRIVRKRVRERSARLLRAIMDALLMADRKQLWADLTDGELREILSRSTVNQLYNFLEDALESTNEESKLLGREIATRLVKLDVSALMAKTDLTDVSMFAHAAMALDPGLGEKILDQILQSGLEGIIKREEDKSEVASKISLMLRAFSSDPHIAREFLRDLTQPYLLPYIRTSKTGGLQHLTYWALVTDEELSREWFLNIGKQMWADKICEATDDEAFWLLWNLFQVESTLACSLANVAEIYDKVMGTPQGVGLLTLCGVAVKNVMSILPQVSSNLAEPWDASKLALTLKALCLSDFRAEGAQILANLDLSKVIDTFQNPKVPKHTREIFMKILSEFEKLRQDHYSASA